MIISPQVLIAAIEHDLSFAKSIYNKTQDEAKTLEEVAYSDALGTGQAATAFRSLIQEVLKLVTKVFLMRSLQT